MPLIAEHASGICLDIGPGNGEWLKLLAQASKKNRSTTKIYGVEPNVDMHATLREKILRAGLENVYEILSCGAQDLIGKKGLRPGSINTIFTLQWLCSVPGPEGIIASLAPLLKAGGKWIVHEHVRTEYSGHFVEGWQVALNYVWPHFFGGCEIRRRTDEWLIKAAEWRHVELRSAEGVGPYDAVPFVARVLMKA
jgi:ubiquinone/menaquinone biosynthesis C-methylase UbiE